MSGRVPRITFTPIALACAAALGLGCIGSTQKAQPKRVVLLKIKGKANNQFRAQVLDVLAENYELVNRRTYVRAAKRLRATTFKRKHVRKVARKVGADVVIDGKLVKKRKSYRLRLNVREGESGKRIERIELRIEKRKLRSKDQRELAALFDEKLAAVAAMPREDDQLAEKKKKKDAAKKRKADARAEKKREAKERKAKKRDKKRKAKERAERLAREQAEREERELEEEREAERRAKKDKKKNKKLSKKERAAAKKKERAKKKKERLAAAKKKEKKKKKEEEPEEPWELKADKSGQAIDDEEPGVLKKYPGKK